MGKHLSFDDRVAIVDYMREKNIVTRDEPINGEKRCHYTDPTATDTSVAADINNLKLTSESVTTSNVRGIRLSQFGTLTSTPVRTANNTTEIMEAIRSLRSWCEQQFEQLAKNTTPTDGQVGVAFAAMEGRMAALETTFAQALKAGEPGAFPEATDARYAGDDLKLDQLVNRVEEQDKAIAGMGRKFSQLASKFENTNDALLRKEVDALSAKLNGFITNQHKDHEQIQTLASRFSDMGDDTPLSQAIERAKANKGSAMARITSKYSNKHER